jgi:hypothetical protein
VDAHLRFLQLTAFTAGHQDEMTRRAEDAIGAAGGWLVDVWLYSNKSVTLLFEVPSAGLARLHAALLATGLRMDAEGLAQLASATEREQRGPSPRDVTGTLSITFVRQQGDVRRTIPSVPG